MVENFRTERLIDATHLHCEKRSIHFRQVDDLQGIHAGYGKIRSFGLDKGTQ
jgi:hypothetical protein